ncbi:MAG TPA: hypothetical protein VFV89_13580 [Nocardioides sp.]|uniref:hypothetical protein n=1 Tax=Nocardioides sp. TaxID=35761 RepID=UPI002E31682C|nr:hypothetical protein [Nocardioides sp.]HEX5088836.1 hypothetical protein [Nocardioides sp.]
MKAQLIPLAAAGLAATSLSLASAPARADGSPAPAGAYSGYSASGIATPVKIEVFEPTIPLPTTPQGEFDLGYAKVRSNSAGTSGRASFMWPGDAIGEGLKTFFSELGLPTEPVENGYPVQVNSEYPSGTTRQRSTPLPGTSMSTESGEDRSRATVGFSTDCNAGDGAGDDSGDPDSGGSVVPGLPVPLLDNLDDILGLLGLGGQQAPTSPRSSAPATPAGGGSSEQPDSGSTEVCPLPSALSALVDVNGYVADSQSVSDGTTVQAISRSALGEVRLLGGVVTMSGISSSVVSASDGTTGRSQGRADYGTMTIAGQTFGVGPEGFTAAGRSGPIPALPDDPTAALAALGITVQVPEPAYKADGDKASGTVEGMVVTIDLKTLKPALSQINLGPILAQVPFPPQAAPLKSLLGAIGNLSPRIVLHLGYATSAVDTVQPIKIPATVPDNDPTGSPTEDPGGSATGGATGGGAVPGGGGGLPPVGGAAGGTDGGAGTDTAGGLSPASASPGLPPLFSIPGLLLCAGLGGALLAGSYVRRLGALVLGAGGACAHGLESGLPDLRKVQ